MARLPIVNGDDGRWGDILNEYLLVAHNNDGTLRSDAPTSGAVDEVYVTNAIQGKVNRSELAAVATTGSYSDLANTPDVVLNTDGRLTNTRTPTDGSVTTAKLADASITEPKLAITNSPTNGDVLTWDGTDLSWQVPSSAPVQSVNGRTGSVVVTKADLSLDNVNNTNDADKPVSTATQTALNAKADTSSLSTVATSGSYTDLANKPTFSTVASTGAYADLTGKPTIPTAGTGLTNTAGVLSVNYGTSGTSAAAGNDSRITGALQTSTYTTKGDLLAATGSGAVNRLAVGTDGQVLSADSSQASGVKWTTPASAPVSSVAGKTGAVSLVKADVGLTNVDNTSDANKPVSTATQTALNAKADSSSLSTVATSGSYNDLSNKPTLSTVANTGAYADLTGKPTIPTAGTTAGTYAAGNDSRITGALQSTIATTKGDVLAATGSSSFNRVAVGTDGQVLTADSSQATGVKWATPSTGSGSGGSSPQFPRPIIGEWVGIRSDNNNLDTMDGQGNCDFFPVFLPEGSYDQVSICIQTGGSSGTTVRIGLYEMNAEMTEPGALICQTSELTADQSNNSLIGTLSGLLVIPSGGKVVWAGVVAHNTTSAPHVQVWRSIPQSPWYIMPGTPELTDTYTWGIRYTITGAFPATLSNGNRSWWNSKTVKVAFHRSA